MNNSSSIPMESSDPVLFADDGTFLVHKRTCRAPSCLDVELVANDGHYACPECGLIGDRVHHEDLFAKHGGGAHAQKDKSVYQLMHGVDFRKTAMIDTDDAEILLETKISGRSFHKNKNSADARDEDADRKFGQFSRRFNKYGNNSGDNDTDDNPRKRKNNSLLSILQEAQASTNQYSSRAWGVFFKERMDSISDALLDAAVILGRQDDGEDTKSLKTGWLARALHIMCTFIWKTTQLKKRQDVVASVVTSAATKKNKKKKEGGGGDELDQYRIESKRAEVASLVNKTTGVQLLDWDNEKEVLGHVTNTIAEQLAPSLTKRRRGGGGRAYVRAYLAIALASCRRALGECHSSLMPWRLAVKTVGRCKSTMSRYDTRIAEQVGLRPWTRLESLIGQCMFYLDLFPKLAGYVPADIDAMRVVRHVYTAATRRTAQQQQQHVAKKKKKKKNKKEEGEEETKEMTNQEYKQCLARIAGHFDELVVRLRAEHENNNNNKQKRPALSEVKTDTGSLDQKMPHQDRIITAVIAYLTLHHRLQNYKFRHASSKLSVPNGSTSLAKDLEVRHEIFCARVQMELSTFRSCLQNLDAYFLMPIVKQQQQSSPMAWVEGTSVNDFGD
jgi:hypothetical protein